MTSVDEAMRASLRRRGCADAGATSQDNRFPVVLAANVGGDDDTCPDSRANDRRVKFRASVAGVLTGFLPFVVVLWDFRADPLRSARADRFSSNFYDIQARALFHGNLALPDRVLGIESFVRDSDTYMYFPPFPAILRMPVLLLTDRFDGRLTAPSMLLAWAVLAASTVLLVWRVRTLVRGSTPMTRTDAAAGAVLIAAITGGSVLLYIGSLPWAYHEVYLWSAAFGVSTLASLVGLVPPAGKPRVGLVLVIGASLVGLILTRATAGWPMALAVVATGVWFSLRRVDRQRQIGVALIAAGLVPLAISAAINWIKFRHPFMIPLEYQEWTRTNARRRMALMMNGGSLAGPQFLPTNLINYFRPDGIRFVPYFPFVTLPSEPGRAYAGAFVDQMYRTGSVPAFMPLLFLLSLWGFVTVFRRRAHRAIVSLRLPMLGALAVTATVMCYGYIGFRYTSEFIAVLAIGSAVGLADVTRRLAPRARRQRVSIVGALATLAAFSIYANGAVGLASARATERGSQLVQYISWQDRVSSVSGDPLAELVRLADELPSSAPADELWIVGDCDALYLATGDLYEPWVTVEMRTISVLVEASQAGYSAASLGLFDVDSDRPVQVMLETGAGGEVRLRVGNPVYYLPTEWQKLGDGERLEVRLTADTAHDRIYVAFGESTTIVPLARWNHRWRVEVTGPAVRLAPLDEQLRAGVSLTPRLGPPLELCNRLLDRVDR